MQDAAPFWDKVAPKYAKDPISDMAAYEYTLGRTQSYLNTDARVLEIGCGTGSTAMLLAPHAREIVATDVSSKMIEIAKEKAAEARLDNLDLRVATAQDAAKLREPFDVVTGFNIFHLLRGAEDVFAGIHRMLPVGGLFISKTPCLSDPSVGLKRFAFRAMIPPMQWIGKAPFVRFFTQRELEDAIRFAGFEIVESGNFPAISRYIVAKRV